jgi:hypothetical protein
MRIEPVVLLENRELHRLLAESAQRPCTGIPESTEAETHLRRRYDGYRALTHGATPGVFGIASWQ